MLPPAESMRNGTGSPMGRSHLPNQREKDVESSRDLKDWFDSMRPVAYGVSFGIIIGSVVFAITQSVLWLGLAVSFGIVVGAAFQANRK